MSEDLDRLLTAVEAADFLHISLSTLGRMQRMGYLRPFRTIGGHRRYSFVMLKDYLERSRTCGASGVGVDSQALSGSDPLPGAGERGLVRSPQSEAEVQVSPVEIVAS